MPLPPLAEDPAGEFLCSTGCGGAAVLLVMFAHFGKPETAGFGVTLVRGISSLGWAGVDLFFVLSGFLIAGILLDTRDSRAIAAYTLTPTRVDGLAIGALIAMLARSSGGLTRWMRFAPWRLSAAIGGIAWVFSREPHFYYSSWKVIPVVLPALAIGFGALLLLTVAGDPEGLLQRCFRGRALRFYGRYSDGLYVWHPFVGWLMTGAGLTQQALARFVPGGGAAALTSFVLRTGVAAGVALISWQVIEQPFLRLKNRATYAPATNSLIEPVRSTST